MRYHIDLVVCIDCTGSMSPVIGQTKLQAMRFHEDLFNYMSHIQKDAAQLRVKVIGFRDFYDKGAPAIAESGFFTLPAQADKFNEFIGKLEAAGGGDEPENALEAIALAMRSDWDKGGDKRRHAVVVWTDASPHELEKRKSTTPAHPMPTDRLPSSFDELTDWWEGGVMDKVARRLVLFAPEHPVWSRFSGWDQCTWYPSQAGDGLGDVDYTEIISQVAQSIEGGGQ